MNYDENEHVERASFQDENDNSERVSDPDENPCYERVRNYNTFQI